MERAPLTAHLMLAATALLIEAAAGYPTWLFERIGHPVTWMGGLLSALDRRLNHDAAPPDRRRRNGALALAALLSATVASTIVIARFLHALLPSPLALLALAVLASSCLAQRSLYAHVAAVADALADDRGLYKARAAVGKIVGRDTTLLDHACIARAAIESLAENFADGVVAPALWLVLLGLPGAFVYKAVNTADSMIGHRTPRYAAFGFAAAKVDDAVNWPAARLAALLLVVASAILPQISGSRAWRVMRRDAHGHPSPNAGWPEAAMAGGLGIRLGGPRAYAGQRVDDAFIGEPLGPSDVVAVRAALRVYRLACGLQIALVLLLWLLTAPWR